MQKWSVRSAPEARKSITISKTRSTCRAHCRRLPCIFIAIDCCERCRKSRKQFISQEVFCANARPSPRQNFRRPLAPVRLSHRTVIFFYRNYLFRPPSEAKKSISISTGSSVETCGRPRDRSQATALTSASVASNCYIFL